MHFSELVYFVKLFSRDKKFKNLGAFGQWGRVRQRLGGAEQDRGRVRDWV